MQIQIEQCTAYTTLLQQTEEVEGGGLRGWSYYFPQFPNFIQVTKGLKLNIRNMSSVTMIKLFLKPDSDEMCLQIHIEQCTAYTTLLQWTEEVEGGGLRGWSYYFPQFPNFIQVTKGLKLNIRSMSSVTMIKHIINTGLVMIY